MTVSRSPGRWSRRCTTRSQCRTLFATHYHELTRLAGRSTRLSLHHVRAREWKGELVLLHEVADGAGRPQLRHRRREARRTARRVVARAKSVLAKLEAGRDATGGIAAGLDDLPLFAADRPTRARPGPIARALDQIDPDSLSPREALEHISAQEAGSRERRMNFLDVERRRAIIDRRENRRSARRRCAAARG